MAHYRLRNPVPLAALAVGASVLAAALLGPQGPAHRQRPAVFSSRAAYHLAPAHRVPVYPGPQLVADRYGVPAATLRRVLRWAPLVRRYAPKHPALALAVVAVESKGVPTATRYNGAGLWDRGLMQVDSENWATYGLTWATAANPAANVRAGAAILRRDVARYGVWGGLALYNSGEPVGDAAYTQAVVHYWPAIRAALGGT